jgi:hypothetical protein
VSAAAPDPEDARRGAGRLADLATALGLEAPPFSGPLLAFDPAEERRPGDQIYLGGDLHAVHPEASAGAPPHGVRDGSLDGAKIILDDEVEEPLEVFAVEGIWCTALSGERLDSAPYFSISDTDGRLRTWLLLPPPRLLIGLAHLWLPAVPPPRERRPPTETGAS